MEYNGADGELGLPDWRHTPGSGRSCVRHGRDGVMKVDIVEYSGPALLLRAQGRINILTCDLFEAYVLTASGGSDRDVIIDGSDVTYLSSAGLRAFLRVWQDLNKVNRNLHVCSLKPYIQEVFHIIGFDKLIPIHPDIAGALDDIQGQSAQSS